jgi:hypothetical protein
MELGITSNVAGTTGTSTVLIQSLSWRRKKTPGLVFFFEVLYTIIIAIFEKITPTS